MCVVDVFEENQTRFELRNYYDFKIGKFQIVRYAKNFLGYQVPHWQSKLSRAHKYSDNLNLFLRNIRKLSFIFILILNFIGCRF